MFIFTPPTINSLLMVEHQPNKKQSVLVVLSSTTCCILNMDTSSSNDNADSLPALADDDKRSDKKEQQQEIEYNPKKPKWWKNVAGKATKGQKNAMKIILATHRLPRVPYGEFIGLSEIFPANNDIWLEIGFGNGENLLALAHRKRNETISLIGAEIHSPGIGIVCRRMQEGIQTNKFWSDYDVFSDENTRVSEDDDDESEFENPYNNLRIHSGDGIKLLPYIPPSSLDTILITFPDPFPKENQAQWRVVQTSTILQLHRILQTNGRFLLATDHDGFYEWSHFVMDIVNKDNEHFERLEECPDRSEWLPVISKYERKGWEEGRQTKLSCWRKKDMAINV